MADIFEIAGRIHSTSQEGVVTTANEILDKSKNRKQNQINAETETALADRYTKDETYSKSQVNQMVAPQHGFVTVATYADLANISEHPVGCVYRVSNYDGTNSQVDATKYSEYSWDGAQYIHLATKSQIGEVFDVSVYNATGGTLATYDSLDALLSDDNLDTIIPEGVRHGGMSIKFVLTDDSKYVQYFLTKDEWSANEADWQKINLEQEVSQLGQGVYNFILFGKGSNNISYHRIITKTGVKYHVHLNNPNFNYTGTLTKFFIRGYLNNVRVANAVNVNYDGVVDSDYYFTAVEADYYQIQFRAEVGSDCAIWVEELPKGYNYYDVSLNHTHVVDGVSTNRFSLSEAIAIVPNEVRTAGIEISYIDYNNVRQFFRQLAPGSYNTDRSMIAKENPYGIFDASYDEETGSYKAITQDEAFAKLQMSYYGYCYTFVTFIDADWAGVASGTNVRHRYRRVFYLNGYDNPTEKYEYIEITNNLPVVDAIGATNSNAVTYIGSQNIAGKNTVGLLETDKKIHHNVSDSIDWKFRNQITDPNSIFLFDGNVFVRGFSGDSPVLPFKKDSFREYYSDFFFLNGYRLPVSNNKIDINAPSTSASFECSVITASENDMFIVAGYSSTTYPLWAFIDSSGNVLLRSEISKTDYYTVIKAPAQTSKLVINYVKNSAWNIFFVKKLYPEWSANNELESRIEQSTHFEKVSDSYSKGAYGLYTNPGKFVVDIAAASTNTSFITYIVPCTEKDIFKITGEGGGLCNLFCFVDTNGVVVKRHESTAFVENMVIATPRNARYLITNFRKTSIYNLWVNSEYAIVENDENEELVLRYGLPLLDDARGRVLEHSLNTALFNFAFITDTHIAGNQREELNAIPNVELFKKFINEGIASVAIHGGDIYTSYIALRSEAFTFIDEFTQRIGNTRIPVYYAKGNHDTNAKYRVPADMEHLDWEHERYLIMITPQLFQEITESEWDGTEQLYTSQYDNNQRISRYQFYLLTENGLDVVHNASDYYGGYFYKDFDSIRIIVLNAYDMDNLENDTMTDMQRDWLRDVALNTDKYCIVFSHVINNKIRGVLSAFVQADGNLIAFIHGHSHADQYDTSDGFNNIGVKNGYGTPAQINAEGNNAFCFSIFSVDLTNKVLYETRVGQGNDRVFNF